MYELYNKIDKKLEKSINQVIKTKRTINQTNRVIKTLRKINKEEFEILPQNINKENTLKNHP